MLAGGSKIPRRRLQRQNQMRPPEGGRYRFDCDGKCNFNCNGDRKFNGAATRASPHSLLLVGTLA
jgi:hypothetical protein